MSDPNHTAMNQLPVHDTDESDTFLNNDDDDNTTTNYSSTSNTNINGNKISTVVDESITTVQTAPTVATGSTGTGNTATTSNIMNAIPLRTFQLPDGRIMDAKNTLQSFDHVVATAAPANSNTKHPPQPRLSSTPPSSNVPVVLARNINGQHSTGAVHQSISSISIGSNRTNGSNNLNAVAVAATATRSQSNIRDDVIHAHAVAVRSVIVAEGELLESQPPQPVEVQPPQMLESQVPYPPHQQPKKSFIFWLGIASVILLVAVVAGIGGYCGSGQCSSDRKTNMPVGVASISSSPAVTKTTAPAKSTPTTRSPTTITRSPILPTVTTNAPAVSTPTTRSPTMITRSPILPLPSTNSTRTRQPASNPTAIPIVFPTISPTIFPSSYFPTLDLTAEPTSDPLMVACSFLNFDTVSECQAVTFYNNVTVGNTIPPEIGLLTQLTDLRLSLNGLTGIIPTTLGDLTRLNGLFLWGNELIGSIPSTLRSLTLLTSLSFSSNRLSGIIPSALGDLVQLAKLELHNNTQLVGIIPSSLCSVSNINIIIDCENIECLCCKESGGASCS